MKRQYRILASTALGLLITSAPLAAFAFGNAPVSAPETAAAKPFILAQTEGGETEEELLKKKQQQQEAPAEEAPPAAEEPAPEPEAAPQPELEPAPEPEPQPEPEAAPQPEPAPEPEAPAESAPEPEAEPAPEPAPQAEPAPEQPAEQPVPEPQPQPEAPAEQPPEGAPAPEAPAEQPEAEPAPAPEIPAQPAPAPEAPATEAPATPAPEAPAEQPSTEPAPAEPAPSGEQPAQPGAEPAQPGAQPAHPSGEAPATPAPEGQAPVLDSQKQAPRVDGQQPAQQGTEPAQPAPGAEPAQPAQPVQPGAEQPAQPAQPAQPTEPVAPPTDDSAAQQEAVPVEIQPVIAEEGTRIEVKPEEIVRERPQAAQVVREVGDRTIVQINNQIIVQSNDRPRLTRGASDVYYEELPRGRTREVIVREDGTRVVTIRDRYGDVIRRSRIAPDDREYVLVYVDEANYDRVGEWRDPGLDLPPMQLTIPVEEYILNSERVEDEEDYYTFLDQPPVERVERLYSIDEVKRSARIRDKVRRIDLDTINFEFGSAEIAESEIAKLEGVAKAMERLLKENPAETFLIEGHTDAVGSAEANLALSDQRAEAVAEALTNVFGIQPENLAPQGYGEQYLKVKTEERERENRRVAIRRITPLVAPVASAK